MNSNEPPGRIHLRLTRAFIFVVVGLLIGSSSRAGDEGNVSAAQLRSLLKHGRLIEETKNKFQADMEKPKNISMYGLTNATFWTADMDIDCDGRETAACNRKTDPWFQNQLSCGTDVAADETPYFVIPIGSPANSRQRGIEIGQVGAVLYQDRLVYAVFLDECGVSSLIGEASCATAKLLGINPDPKNGGTDEPVTYIVFSGPGARITDRNDYTNHAKATEIGVRCASELIAHYSETNSLKAGH